MTITSFNNFNIFGMGNFGFGSFNPFGYCGFVPNFFNFSYIPTFTSSIFSLPTSMFSVKPISITPVRGSRGVSISKNQNASAWAKLGYCAEAGMRLAKTALNSAVGFISKCATYVKNAISRSGLGKYETGNGCDMVYVMRRNKKFKEINPAGVDVKKLPAGCVIVYGKGVAGYSRQYGHVEISTGDGRAVSDGITRNPRKNPTAIFMPITT